MSLGDAIGLMSSSSVLGLTRPRTAAAVVGIASSDKPGAGSGFAPIALGDFPDMALSKRWKAWGTFRYHLSGIITKANLCCDATANLSHMPQA